MTKRLLPKDPDLPLLKAIGRGDARALQELYQRHGAGILSFLIDRLHDRQQAEEVLQDVMLAVWKSAAAFRGECKVRTWLLTIAHHRAIDTYHRSIPANLSLQDVAVVDSADVAAMVERNLLYEKMTEVFRNLPTEQREVVKLIFYHGLTYAEVAQVLGVPEGTVKSRLHHARLTLRRSLQMEGITHA